jgi:hypothetical protein
VEKGEGWGWGKDGELREGFRKRELMLGEKGVM